MALSNFAVGLGSLAGGIEAGENIKKSWDERTERENEQKGKELWLDTLNSDDPTGPAGPAGQVGQPPAPAAPADPTPGAAPINMDRTGPISVPPAAPQGAPAPSLPGATSMPQGVSAPPQPVGMPGATPIAPPANPSPAPPPQAGPAPPPAQGGAGQGDQGFAQQFAALRQSNTQWLRSKAQAMRKAHPDATPGQIAAALEYGIKQDESLGGTEKLMLQSQAAQLRAEVSASNAALAATSREHVADTQVQGKEAVEAMRDSTLKEIAQLNGLNKVDLAHINAASRAQVAATSAGARIQAAGIAANAHVTGEQIAAGARTLAAQWGGEEKEWEAQLKADVTNYRTQGGGLPTTTPAPAARPAPNLGGGGAAPAAGGPPKVDPVKEKADAQAHIRAGADAAKVRAIYQQRTGKPADF